MALSDFFVHRATIQRATESRGSSGEVLKTWSDWLSLLPCRLVVQDERIASPQGLLVATTYRLIIPANQDVRAGDRVSEVVDERLQTSGPFDVASVIPRLGRREQNHVTLRLEKVE